jgi:hypothetical protein
MNARQRAREAERVLSNARCGTCRFLGPYAGDGRYLCRKGVWNIAGVSLTTAPCDRWRAAQERT